MASRRIHPPYQLRVNKAVDRLLLAKLLLKFGTFDQCTYYSLAGPFLEDLRLMHHYFPQMKLVSFEDDPDTYSRQDFHRFCSESQLDLKDELIGSFILHSYVPKEKDVFWLDYTGLDARHFNDFQEVLKAVLPGSIIRITLRAQPDIDLDALEDQLLPENIEFIKEKINRDFEENYDKLLPVPVPNLFADLKDYALTIQYMIRKAASEALDISGSPVDFLPIESSRYKDGVQMISLTGMVYSRENEQEIIETLTSKGVKKFDWDTPPQQINVPALSIKELLALESSLPIDNGENAGDVLVGILDYMDKKQLAHYAEYHREYPQFIRITT